eukprot:1177805-Rhodomonas_salina.4
MATIAELQQQVKDAGEKVKTLKGEKRDKKDPELVAAIASLMDLKKQLEEASRPVETNPFVSTRAELDDIAKVCPNTFKAKEIPKLRCVVEVSKVLKMKGIACISRYLYPGLLIESFDIYGGTAGFYTYGPPGAALKANIIALWRRHFIIEENLLEIESCLGSDDHASRGAEDLWPCRSLQRLHGQGHVSLALSAADVTMMLRTTKRRKII